jgi:hypothetical protein
VTFVGWLLGLQAVTLCLAALVLLLAGPEMTEPFESLGIGVGSLTVIGFITLVYGLALFLVIFALFDGSRVARIIATVLLAFSLVNGVVTALSDRSTGGFTLISAIIAFVALACLWATPGATEFFGPEGRPERRSA